MLKKIILLIASCSLIATTQASTCPEPIDIRAQQLYGWKAYNIDSGQQLTPQAYARFAQRVEVFALAEWIRDSNPSENIAHCYYYGAKKDSNYLGVYFAKQKIRPDTSARAWSGKGTGYMRCEDNLYDCRFVEQ